MGFLKKLLFGTEVSEEEQKRRMGNVQQKQEEKPVSQMNEDEILEYYRKIRDLEDIPERISGKIKLAEVGYQGMFGSIVDDYFELSKQTGEKPQWEEIKKWSEKAADAGDPDGHRTLGLYYLNQVPPQVESCAREYFLSMEGGWEPAAFALQELWNRKLEASSGYSAEELSGMLRKTIAKGIEPEMQRLSGSGSEEEYAAYGFMYYLGIYFPQDYGKAREYFTKGKNEYNSIIADEILERLNLDDEDEEDE